ncbi:hypothetical protein VNO78_13162 [Psophocarpus tetragonolobus]|uniref:Uncharacterized protein n=1 Tax=Psophocarpus tetragonolobus TaxID=3891 RepID=A0AAN9XPU7_PSOTE
MIKDCYISHTSVIKCGEKQADCRSGHTPQNCRKCQSTVNNAQYKERGLSQQDACHRDVISVTMLCLTHNKESQDPPICGYTTHV